jgi:hypothetical protein
MLKASLASFCLSGCFRKRLAVPLEAAIGCPWADAMSYYNHQRGEPVPP